MPNYKTTCPGHMGRTPKKGEKRSWQRGKAEAADGNSGIIREKTEDAGVIRTDLGE